MSYSVIKYRLFPLAHTIHATAIIESVFSAAETTFGILRSVAGTVSSFSVVWSIGTLITTRASLNSHAATAS